MNAPGRWSSGRSPPRCATPLSASGCTHGWRRRKPVRRWPGASPRDRQARGSRPSCTGWSCSAPGSRRPRAICWRGSWTRWRMIGKRSGPGVDRGPPGPTLLSRTAAWAANTHERSMRISRSFLGHSRRSRASIASSRRSWFAVVWRSRAASSRRSHCSGRTRMFFCSVLVIFSGALHRRFRRRREFNDTGFGDYFPRALCHRCAD